MRHTITSTKILDSANPVPEEKGLRLFVSVIIPIRRREDPLLKFLKLLQRQGFPEERYEIIHGKSKIKGDANGNSEIVNGRSVFGG